MESKFSRSDMNGNSYIEDFRDGKHNWETNNSANGTLNNSEIDGMVGVRKIRVTSIATAVDYANFQRNNAGNEEIKLGQGRYKLEFFIYINNVPDVTNDFIIRMGLMNVTNQYSGVTDGVFFKIQNSDGGKFKAVSIVGGSSTITDTGIIPSNGEYFRFKIVVNKTASKMRFFIGDGKGSEYVEVAVHESNIPIDYIGILFGIDPVGSMSNARDIDIDYVKEKYVLSEGR